jgi:pilus assembly protein CpaE
MNLVLRTAIVDRDSVLRKELRAALTDMDLVRLEAEYPECSAFSLTGGLPDVVLVGVDSDTDRALDLISRLSRQTPRCGICAVSRSNDGQLVLRAIRAGAKEFLTLPVSTRELSTALRAACVREEAQGSRPHASLTIAVAGAAGGVGSTSLAVNLASILAASPDRSVVLVDLDVTLGDADVYLDMNHEYTLADLTQNVARLDSELLRRSMARHKSGLYLLPRPVELSDAGLVTEESLRRVFRLLKTSYSHVVVDLSKAYSPLDMAALECCDAVLLVTQLDLPCLRNAVRLLKSFRPVSGMLEKVKLVVNRTMPESETIRLKRAEEIVGREFFWQIPNDYRLMVQARNNGVPLVTEAPRAEITQSLTSMARVLVGDEIPGVKRVGRTSGATPVLGKWFGFWSAAAPKASSPTV